MRCEIPARKSPSTLSPSGLGLANGTSLPLITQADSKNTSAGFAMKRTPRSGLRAKVAKRG